MTRLIWDEVGSRNFETGIDRGVLYDQNNVGYAWNGLTSVVQDFGESNVSAGYYEGLRRHNNTYDGDFSATLSAYTYPDEFLEFEGTYELENGLYVGEQEPLTFGLSYRTRAGDDISGVDAGYKIHVLYDLIATPSSKNYETISSTVDPLEFEWQISGLPQDAPGYKPTAHLIFDSRTINPTLLWILESTFYGNEYSNGRLMSLPEVIQYTTDNWSP